MLKCALYSLLAIVLLATENALGSGDEHKGVPTIGVLLGTNPTTASPYYEAFRRGLRDLGYIDGRNVTVVARYAQGDTTRYPALLKELIELKVDVLFVAPAALFAAKEATSTIPIVSPGFQSDPVAAGLVKSLARPGVNITGLYAMGSDTDTKRLQLAIELIPNLKRLGLLVEASPDLLKDADALRMVARQSGVMLRTYGVRNVDQIVQALADMTKERLQAFMVWNTPLTLLYRDKILSSSVHRLPVIAEGDWAESGAVLAYSADFYEQFRRSAVYVHRILKGENVADMAIEQSTTFKLVVNLKAAKALGVKVPDTMLLRADEIIR